MAAGFIPVVPSAGFIPVVSYHCHLAAAVTCENTLIPLALRSFLQAPRIKKDGEAADNVNDRDLFCHCLYSI